MAGEKEKEKKKSAEMLLKDILPERGKVYGPFDSHARLTQILKREFYNHAKALNISFSYAQCEALDMIFHKLGRIGNGDPNYPDSWIDISGYAKLVVDILEF